MRRHVFILAQGSQSRLPDLPIKKQLIPLYHGDNVSRDPRLGNRAYLTIIERTIHQVRAIDQTASVVVVGGHEIRRSLDPIVGVPAVMDLRVVPLANPGNSSLKGLSQIVDARDHEVMAQVMDEPSSTTVLLGDAIYSWDCLRLLMMPKGAGGDLIRFVTTSDLSSIDGEVWGIEWRRQADAMFAVKVKLALAEHPPFSEYQPGQLRRLIKVTNAHTIVHCDDYTRDIDVPDHLGLIAGLAVKARADDVRQGFVW